MITQEKTPAEMLRAWANAYRTGQVEHRFPSDPTAEFFPVDMERAAAEIDRLRAIVRVNGLRWGHSHAEIDALLDRKE